MPQVSAAYLPSGADRPNFAANRKFHISKRTLNIACSRSEVNPTFGLMIASCTGVQGRKLFGSFAFNVKRRRVTYGQAPVRTLARIPNVAFNGESSAMPSPIPPEIEILLPIHNEAESIEGTIKEIYAELKPFVRAGFILCEDGSKDNTKQVLRSIASEVPAKLFLSEGRKGYSRAVRDGMMELEAPYLLCLDSDGQCDPKDFRKFWDVRDSADILIGWRVDRADTWMRKTMSRTFYRAWKVLYRCPIHDPSCPFMIARREVIQELWPRMGAMQEGFWWEFTARAQRLGFSIREIPVHHRDRAAGITQVYRLKKLPGIGYRHIVALFKIRAETRRRGLPVTESILGQGVE
jgi:Glycosyl transferase family 2